MIREYCDNCNVELNNTYWKTRAGKIVHTINIEIDGDMIYKMVLCDKCFKSVENDIYKLLEWYSKKENEEWDKIKDSVEKYNLKKYEYKRFNYFMWGSFIKE